MFSCGKVNQSSGQRPGPELKCPECPAALVDRVCFTSERESESSGQRVSSLRLIGSNGAQPFQVPEVRVKLCSRVESPFFAQEEEKVAFIMKQRTETCSSDSSPVRLSILRQQNNHHRSFEEGVESGGAKSSIPTLPTPAADAAVCCKAVLSELASL
jgi:hypothetical protein